MNITSTPRELSWHLFTFILFLYILTSGGHFYGADGINYFLMADAVWERFSFDVLPEAATAGGAFGQNGKFYTPFGIGLPVMALPFYFIGMLIGMVLKANYVQSFCVSFFHAFTTAGTCWMLALFLRDLHFSRKIQFITVIIYAFTSLAWPYSRYFYSEPLFTLFSFGAFYLAFKYRQNGNAISLAGCAAFLSLAIFVRLNGMVLLVPLGFYLLIRKEKEGLTAKDAENAEEEKKAEDWQILFIQSCKHLLPFFLILSIPILWQLCYNDQRFGGLFETGYIKLPNGQPRGFTSPLSYGLTVLLFSPGKSLFLFNPYMLIVFAFTARSYRRLKAETVYFLLMTAVFLVLFGFWCRPEGGYTWGPRFLVPILPIGAILLAVPLEVFWQENRQIFYLLIALCCIGFFVQMLGISVNFAENIYYHESEYYSRQTGRYDLAYSPWRSQAGLMWQRLWPLQKQFTEREPMLQQANRSQFVIHVFTWNDCLDFWFLHLIKDGFSVTGVSLAVIFLLTGAIYHGYRTFDILRD